MTAHSQGVDNRMRRFVPAAGVSLLAATATVRRTTNNTPGHAGTAQHAACCGGRGEKNGTSSGIQQEPLGYYAMRQDTHGNRMQVGFYPTQAAADAAVAALQKDPNGAAMEHHQRYWVEAVTD